MDSATCLAEALCLGFQVHALSVVYGQRHAREIRSARRLAAHFGVREHTVLPLELGPLLRSALTDPHAALPRPGRRARGIPATYVPARNTILLAIALGVAETERAEAIFLGINAVDYSGYPDCRPEYLAAFGRLARLATRASTEDGWTVQFRAPLLKLSKAGIVRKGERLGVPWALTWSCYRGGRRPCGACDACALRAKGFQEAGVRDPLLASVPRVVPSSR
ncbi:MAG: 7-cyano-7-deazaguanine synthase QueC [Thermoplasmata archaeon]|nr:7-cyano-7-deazaguanine synthase QueC [Thermoplasmata archaeon]